MREKELKTTKTMASDKENARGNQQMTKENFAFVYSRVLFLLYHWGGGILSVDGNKL